MMYTTCATDPSEEARRRAMDVRRVITVYPPPRLHDLFASPGALADHLDAFPALTFMGRGALYWALRGLGLPAGTPFWIPSFNCPVIVDAALAAGFSPGFYRIRPDLSVDLDDLAGRLRTRRGPVLLIHYFGFAEPRAAAIAELARHFGVMLIEDCAHALFSRAGGVPLGGFGPVAIYSLYKFIGIPHGGALKVDALEYRDWTGGEFQPPPPLAPAPGSTLRYGGEFLRHATRDAIPRLLRRLRPPGAAAADDQDEPPEDPGRYRLGLGRLARRVLAGIDPPAVAAARRRNYKALEARLAEFSSLSPLFPELTEGTCPMVYPLRVADRETLRDRLFERGLDSFAFGGQRHAAVPAAHFPELAALRTDILGLPVHQNLSAADIDRIAGTIGPLLRDHAPTCALGANRSSASS